MLEKLKEIGLTEYEAKVYLTLLDIGPSQGGKICKKSNVPHPKTYESLNTLEKYGFVIVTPVKPKIFSPVDPKTAIKNFMRDKYEHYQRLENNLIQNLQLKEKIEDEDKFLEKVKILVGKKQQFNLSSYMYDTAQKEVKHIFTYEYVPAFLNESIKKSVNNKVRVKIIASDISKEGFDLIKEHLNLGAEIRYYPIQELRIQIKDGEESRITVYNPKEKKERITTYFQHGELSKAMNMYFDWIWKKAKKITKNSKLSEFK